MPDKLLVSPDSPQVFFRKLLFFSTEKWKDSQLRFNPDTKSWQVLLCFLKQKPSTTNLFFFLLARFQKKKNTQLIARQENKSERHKFSDSLFLQRCEHKNKKNEDDVVQFFCSRRTIWYKVATRRVACLSEPKRYPQVPFCKILSSVVKFQQKAFVKIHRKRRHWFCFWAFGLNHFKMILWWLVLKKFRKKLAQQTLVSREKNPL